MEAEKPADGKRSPLPRRRGQRRTKQERYTRRFRIFGMLLLAAILVLVIGPSVIGLTPLPNLLLARAMPASVGTLTAGNMQLSWAGNTTLDKVTLVDSAGNTLLEAKQLEVDASLTDLILGSNKSMLISVVDPIVYCNFTQNSSNWEQFLAAYENQEQTASEAAAATTEQPAVDSSTGFRLANGELRVSDAVTGERWRVGLKNATFSPNGGAGTSLLDSAQLFAEGTVEPISPDGQPLATGTFVVKLDGAEGSADGSSRRLLSAELASLPASLAGVVLRRADANSKVAGWVNGRADCFWSKGHGVAAPGDWVGQLLSRNLTTAGKVNVSNVAYHGQLTGGQTLQLQGIDLPWKITAERNGLVVEQFKVTTEIGAGNLSGRLNLNELKGLLQGVAVLPQTMQLAAEVDLVQLGRIAPQVLRLQEGVTIEEGLVTLEVHNSGPPGGVKRLTGSVRTNRLAGQSNGRRVEWRKPLTVDFTLGQGPQSWQLETLRAVSDFALVTLQAEPLDNGQSRLRGTAKFNLDDLAKELQQFVDLSDWQLSGHGDATCTFDRSANQAAWQMLSNGRLTNLRMGNSTQPLIDEPDLQFVANLSGGLSVAQPGAQSSNQFDSVHVELTGASGDKLLAVLSQAAAGANASVHPIRLELDGDVERWYRRARIVSDALPESPSLLTGSLHLTATGALNSAGGLIEQWEVNLSDLKVGSETAMFVDERRVEASGDLNWDQATGVVNSQLTKVLSSTVSLSAQDLHYNMQRPTESKGRFGLTTNLAKLQRWVAPDSFADGWQATGMSEAKLEFAAKPEGVRIVGHLEGKQCALSQLQPGSNARQVVWSEPLLKSDIDLTIQQSKVAGSDSPLSLVIEQLTVDSQTLTTSTKGEIGDLAAIDKVNLSGNVDYDLQKLTALFAPSLGTSVRFVGQDRATFQIISDQAAIDPATGQVSDPLGRLRAKVEAPWQSADLFGLPVGPGKLSGVYGDGLVRFDPLDVTVGQGRLTAQPTVRLTPEPMMVALPVGPLLTNVDVSLEVADKMLKFIAPVMADSTRVEGQFSLTLSDFLVPAANVAAGQAQGVLTIHQARVLPGPGVQEWVRTVRSLKSLLRDGAQSNTTAAQTELITIQNQPVNFRLSEGRVYHDRFAFNIGEVMVVSQGSVGIDETLDIVLSIPVLDEWVNKNPRILGGLRGQAIRVPIRGTLAHPQVDKNALRQLSKDLIQSAVQGAGGAVLDSLFRKLQSK